MGANNSLNLDSGEHMDEFQQFDTKAFVSRLLGKGDLKQLRQTIEVCLGGACMHD